MKNLALGALLAAASSFTAACTISSGNPPPATDAVVTARWSFSHFADKTARSCPVGYPFATVVWQGWDPVNNVRTGTQVTDRFPCSDMHGTTAPLDGIFLVWVQIENAAGTPYAQSEETYVDTADGDVTLNLDIWDDAGQFFLTWDIVREGSNAPLTCADVGPNAKVGTSATLATDTAVLFADNFPCNHYYGTTDPVLAGRYTLTVQALANDLAIGHGITLTNKTVTSPNGLTDLGHVLIPIP